MSNGLVKCYSNLSELGVSAAGICSKWKEAVMLGSIVSGYEWMVLLVPELSSFSLRAFF